MGFQFRQLVNGFFFGLLGILFVYCIGVLGFLCMLEALCAILVYLEALGAFFDI
jgi:hypothetical protein